MLWITFVCKKRISIDQKRRFDLRLKAKKWLNILYQIFSKCTR
ncbi:hypothetical protein MtrunA17_Chr2g0321521 [Medicago truncatula]|uniref:Uncharacterized protein n=1 Tax=Medicago truncatula TaxID=3880 RepID=A0A396JFJ5_MEDTR|nr:hypothetical protein MtrunA17_Chr2g0321521 [Medicago truncatula]